MRCGFLHRCIKQADVVAGRPVLSWRLSREQSRDFSGVVARECLVPSRLLEADNGLGAGSPWNLLAWAQEAITAHSRQGQTEQALNIFRLLLERNVKPDVGVYVAALKVCSGGKALTEGKLIHRHIVASGNESDLFVGSTLVDMYAKCGSLVDARSVFDRLAVKNLVTWTAMVAGYARHECGLEALALFRLMQEHGFEPNGYTLVGLVKACASLGSLAEGKVLHAYILERGVESDLFVGSALVAMYLQCDSLEDARIVFERMPTKSVVTWTTITSGYVQRGDGHEALRLFRQMLKEGLQPDNLVLVSILKACSSIAALDDGKALHAQLSEAGFALDELVGNSLIDMYAKCGSLVDACAVFHTLTRKDLVSWTTMIQAYAQHGFGCEAVKLYHDLQQEGLEPNHVTLLGVLKACSNIAAFEQGKLVHLSLARSGCEPDLYLVTSLIDMYAKCGSLDDARNFFEAWGKTSLAAWNAIVAGYAQHGLCHEAIELFYEIGKQGMLPDKVTLLSVIKACSTMACLEQGKLIYAGMIKKGFEPKDEIGNACIHMFSNCGSLEDARLVFDRVHTRDVGSWNSMIGGYVQHGFELIAIELFEQMSVQGVQPDQATFMSIVKACANMGSLHHGKLIYAQVKEVGLDQNDSVASTVIDMFAKLGSLEDAYSVFSSVPRPSLVTWNAMLACFANHGLGAEVLQMYQQLHRVDLQPDKYTFLSILNACASVAALNQGKLIHAEIKRCGLETDVFISSALIDMYAKCGSWEEARIVFDNLPTKNVVSWNAMIAGYAQHGRAVDALQLFQDMQADGMLPDAVTFVSLLSACSHCGLLDEAYMLFHSMSEVYCIRPEMEHYVCMVDLLGRAGLLSEAVAFVNNMPLSPEMDVRMSLLGACRTHGNVDFGRLSFEAVLELDATKAAAYVMIADIYALNGKLEESAHIRRMMQGTGLKKEPGRTWMELENEVHSFTVEDKRHSDRSQLYAELEKLLVAVRGEYTKGLPATCT